MDINIELKNVSLDFPLRDIHSYSLKKKLFEISTLNKINFSKSKKYYRALNNINLKIKKGDKFGILGKNGSGKSTLLRVLSKIYFPQNGNVNIYGKILPVIDSSYAIDSFLTGIDNIRISALIRGLNNNDIFKLIDKVNEISELGQFLYMPVHTYSSGMMMRLNFALTLMLEPEILILDEWLSTADKFFQEKANNLMNNFVKKSQILVLATHDLNLIKSICNKAIVLEEGKIIFEGSSEKAIEQYNLKLNNAKKI